MILPPFSLLRYNPEYILLFRLLIFSFTSISLSLSSSQELFRVRCGVYRSGDRYNIGPQRVCDSSWIRLSDHPEILSLNQNCQQVKPDDGLPLSRRDRDLLLDRTKWYPRDRAPQTSSYCLAYPQEPRLPFSDASLLLCCLMHLIRITHSH